MDQIRELLLYNTPDAQKVRGFNQMEKNDQKGQEKIQFF